MTVSVVLGNKYIPPYFHYLVNCIASHFGKKENKACILVFILLNLVLQLLPYLYDHPWQCFYSLQPPNPAPHWHEIPVSRMIVIIVYQCVAACYLVWIEVEHVFSVVGISRESVCPNPEKEAITMYGVPDLAVLCPAEI